MMNLWTNEPKANESTILGDVKKPLIGEEFTARESTILGDVKKPLI